MLAHAPVAHAPACRILRSTLAGLALALAACAAEGDREDDPTPSGAPSNGKYDDTQPGHPECPEIPASCIPPGLTCDDVTYRPAADLGREPRDEGTAIDTIVIHKAEGSLDGAIGTLIGGGKSAHFVVGHQGEIVCIVPPDELAHHLTNDVYQARSIGIEQEGHSTNDDVTEAQMDALVALVHGLTLAYRIPADREHVIGHVEVPKTSPTAEGCGGDSAHSDPGIHFAWDELMMGLGVMPTADLSEAGVIGWEVLSLDAPTMLAPGQLATVQVTLRNTGTGTWENLRLRLHADVLAAPFESGWRLPNEIVPTITGDGGPVGCYGPLREITLSFPIMAPADPGCLEDETSCTRTLTFNAYANLRSGWRDYLDTTISFDVELSTPQ